MKWIGWVCGSLAGYKTHNVAKYFPSVWRGSLDVENGYNLRFTTSLCHRCTIILKFVVMVMLSGLGSFNHVVDRKN